MSLRRVRSHKEGISNIDFRSNHDIKNMRIFEPWHSPKEFGTMGYRNYKNPRKIFKNLFKPSKEINTQKDIVNDYPDPKYYTSTRFYKRNNISINKKAFFNSDKLANLEESFKGKDIFNGDSMNVAEIMRIRKGKKFDCLSYKLRDIIRESFSFEDKKIQERKIAKLTKDKKKENNTAIQETQLVKIINYRSKDKEKNIGIKKIEEIRNAIRRRYGNRKNIYKLFQLWAKTYPNKITIYDAYKVINALSIPINYNEAKVFIASASSSGNDYLNIEEFSNLIHEPIEINFGNKTKKFLFEEKEQDKIINHLITSNKLNVDSINMGKLKDFISQRILVLNKNMKELTKEKYYFKEDDNNKTNNINLVDFDKFLKGILSLKPTDNFGKEKYIKKLFDEHKNKDGLVDMKTFGETLYEKNTKEIFAKLKDKTIEISKDQYKLKAEKLENYISKNSEKIKPFVFQKKMDLDRQITEKKLFKEKKREEQKKFEDQLNSTIPSTNWVHHIYDNRKEHFNFLNRVELSLSAKPSFKQNNLKYNTRFSASPPWKNTADILIGDENCSTYITEKQRFQTNKNIGKEDKKIKQLTDIAKQNRIKTALGKVENNVFAKIFLKEEKDIYSDMEKNKRMSIYDENMKNRNLIIE